MRGHLGTAATSQGSLWLSQLFFYSAACSARKSTATGIRYELRVNPSSGNLHPTEIHFAASGLPGWSDGLYHYRPRTHAVERRAAGHYGFPGQLTIILSTIPWREAWKYGDRAYRYCLLDAGHLAESIRLAARALGHEVSILPADTMDTSHLRLSAEEWPLLAMVLGGAAPKASLQDWAGGNCSPYPLPSEVVQSVHAASSGALRSFSAGGPPAGGRSFSETVRTRRSALDFSGGDMSLGQLAALLTLLVGPAYLFVHRVTGLAPGLYRYTPSRDLERIRDGDQRVAAAGLSLRQDLAGNACVLFSLFSTFSEGYRGAHMEAGAAGQRLYIGAEALGLQATGIGAFFDDRVWEYCGSPDAEPVYHFAVGHAIPDERLLA